MIVPIMLDSGAFSAYTRKKTISLDDYIEFATKAVRKIPDITVVNLDVIGDGAASFRNWQEMRASGLNPLPVFHVTTNIKWLKRYLNETNYIGIGAMARMPSTTRKRILERLWNDHLLDSSGMPLVKVHGMGLTAFKSMERYPWFSCDSVTWLLLAGFGGILVPAHRQGKPDWTKKPYIISVSSTSRTKPALSQRHFEDLGPVTKQTVLDWMSSEDFVFGTYEGISKYKTNDRRSGVCGSRTARAVVNGFVFATFVGHLAWPRPFVGARKRSLFPSGVIRRSRGRSRHRSDPPRPDTARQGTTLLYLGIPIRLIERLLIRKLDETHSIGFLHSFFKLVSVKSLLPRISRRGRG